MFNIQPVCAYNNGDTDSDGDSGVRMRIRILHPSLASILPLRQRRKAILLREMRRRETCATGKFPHPLPILSLSILLPRMLTTPSSPALNRHRKP
jgi:hypothetical protein